MLTIVYTIALGLGIGVTAIVARRIGEKDPEPRRNRRAGDRRGLGNRRGRGVIGLFAAAPCWR